jgi:hypothetical protein
MAAKSDLERFLKENQPAKKFVPYCFLDKQSDTLTAYFEGDPDYSKRLSEHLTLYLSLETDEIIGCRVKGISGIIEDLPNFIHTNHKGVDLSIVFFAFTGGAEAESRKALKDLALVAKEREMVIEPCAA